MQKYMVFFNRPKLLLLLVAATSFNLPNAFGSEIKDLVSEYLIHVSSSIYCPKNVKINVAKNAVIIFGNSTQEGQQRVLSNVNNGITKQPQEFGAFSETRTTFANNLLLQEYRACGGIIIKRCLPWQTLNSLTVKDSKNITITTPKSAPSYDFAGFPEGEACSYNKL